MKVVLPGGSGQVGSILARRLASEGHEVVVLSRRPAAAAAAGSPWQVVEWDARTIGPWEEEVHGADVVVNLAGRSVNCRYGARNRREILESRVESTRAVGEAIRAAVDPPRAWLQMSTATIYAHRFDAANDEATGLLGGVEPDAPRSWRFGAEVARAWEAAATSSAPARTRVVLLRTAMVMSPDRGGVFDVLLGLVRRGLGGTSGDGRQFVSWIHDRDFARAVSFLIDREVSGPVNLAAPGPLPNAAFMRGLRDAWGARLGLPATRWMLEAGAAVLRTESELILKSRRVVPGRLLDAGFSFDFPGWPGAAADLCRRWRAGRSGPASRAGRASSAGGAHQEVDGHAGGDDEE